MIISYQHIGTFQANQIYLNEAKYGRGLQNRTVNLSVGIPFQGT